MNKSFKKLVKDLEEKYKEIINERGKGPLYNDGWIKLIFDVNKNDIRFQIDGESVRDGKYKDSFIPICFHVMELKNIEKGIKYFYNHDVVKEFRAENSRRNPNILGTKYNNYSYDNLKILYEHMENYLDIQRMKKIDEGGLLNNDKQ